MPRPTDINVYPEQFFEFARCFEESETGVEIPCPNPSANRLDLYAFRSALRHSGRISEFPKFDAAVMVSDEQNKILSIQNRNQSETAVSLRKALADPNHKAANGKE